MKRILRLIAYFFIYIAMFFGLNGIFNTVTANDLKLSIQGDCINSHNFMEIFYCEEGDKNQFTQEKTFTVDSEGTHTIRMPNQNITDLRLDFGSEKNKEITLNFFEYGFGSVAKGYNTLYIDAESDIPIEMNDVELLSKTEGGIVFKTVGADPYIAIHDVENLQKQGVVPPNRIYLVLSALLPLVIVVLLYRYVHFKKIAMSVKDFYAQRKLILNLAVNDFKTRFAGSVFGTVWAFVQPICTILVFWFVFQVGFRNPNVGDVQYILWFMTGLIPWFFFSEAWNSATNAFIDYSYLVKKVVFKINILPFIKIISALFVHLFFVAFMMVVYALYHRFPTMYYIQIVYYMLCMVALVAALSFVTAPLIIFFRDMGQIMSIVLQFGMWLTPIMWSVDNLPQGMGGLVNIFKLNPMYYIVQGYRNSMIYNVPFYQNSLQTVYFWAFVLIAAIAGSTIYTRLKPHFADVL